MKAPYMPWYLKDWCTDQALARCSWQAQGVYPHVLLMMHTSDEYGVLRWPLAEIASTARVPLRFLKELASKNVLKGGDVWESAFVHAPTHAGRTGEPVTLVEGNGASCWFVARMVRDEWARKQRGKGTRFTPDNQPSRSPTRRVGDESGDGLAVAVAFALDSSNNTATETLLGPAEDLALALRGHGYSECSAMHPELVAAKAEGITGQELVDVAKAKGAGKPIAYLVQTARGKRADAIERGKQSGGSSAAAAAPVDLVAVARAQRQRFIDDQRLTIANDFRLGLIDEGQRDSRLAALDGQPERAAEAHS